MTEQDKQEQRIIAVLEGKLPDEALYEEDIAELRRRVDAAIAKKIADRRTIVHDGKAYALQ